MIAAHFDSWFYTPGACDNASGTAVLLGMVETFASRQLAMALEFVAFNGEEIGPVSGSKPYEDLYGISPVPFQPDMKVRFPEALDPIALFINIDGVGMSVSTNNFGLESCSKALEQDAVTLLEHFPGMKYIGHPHPGSNHYPFYTNGVPCISFNCSGEYSVYHTLADTAELISGPKMSETFEFVARLTEHACSQDPRRYRMTPAKS